MAAIRLWVPVRDERPDGLCPHCLNPALKLYRLQQIDWDGVTIIGTRVGCRDCKKMIGPLVKETPHAH